LAFSYNKGQTVALFNNQVCLNSLAVHDLSPTIQLLEGKTLCPLTGQQHLEDVVRGVQLVQVVRGVQVVLVVQTYQHLEDVVRGVQAKLCKLDNTLKTLCKVLNFQMDLNNHSIFLVNFCILIKYLT